MRLTIDPKQSGPWSFQRGMAVHIMETKTVLREDSLENQSCTLFYCSIS